MPIGDLVKLKHKPLARMIGVIVQDQGQMVRIIWSRFGGHHHPTWEWAINLEVINESR